MDRVLTIGVYGWTAEGWLEALAAAGCDAVVDIRARRGVRGREYAFANRSRLEVALAAAGIRYLHRSELAPSAEIRRAQKDADTTSGTRKRDRATMDGSFSNLYSGLIADQIDWNAFATGLDATAPALLCVERTASACHRSIAADRLAAAVGADVVDLVPA